MWESEQAMVTTGPFVKLCCSLSTKETGIKGPKSTAKILTKGNFLKDTLI